MSRARRCDPLVVPLAGWLAVLFASWLVVAWYAAEADAPHDCSEAVCSPF